jgi:hypothetical protein
MPTECSVVTLDLDPANPEVGPIPTVVDVFYHAECLPRDLLKWRRAYVVPEGQYEICYGCYKTIGSEDARRADTLHAEYEHPEMFYV